MRIACRRLSKFFQGRLYGTALRVSQNHDEPGTESRRGELNAVNLGRCNDITGNTDDEKVTEPLVENNFSRDPRVRTTEDNREGLLPLCHLDSLRMAQVCVASACA